MQAAQSFHGLSRVLGIYSSAVQNGVAQIVKDTIETYRQENNLIGNFILDECDIDKTFVQPAGELYSRFS